MNATIERVVAEHIERIEFDLRSARSDVESLRESFHKVQSQLREATEKRLSHQGEAARLQKLVDDIRAVLDTDAKGHDLVKVADAMRRELEALKTPKSTSRTESTAGGFA